MKNTAFLLLLFLFQACLSSDAGKHPLTVEGKYVSLYSNLVNNARQGLHKYNHKMNKAAFDILLSTKTRVSEMHLISESEDKGNRSFVKEFVVVVARYNALHKFLRSDANPDEYLDQDTFYFGVTWKREWPSPEYEYFFEVDLLRDEEGLRRIKLAKESAQELTVASVNALLFEDFIGFNKNRLSSEKRSGYNNHLIDNALKLYTSPSMGVSIKESPKGPEFIIFQYKTYGGNSRNGCWIRNASCDSFSYTYSIEVYVNPRLSHPLMKYQPTGEVVVKRNWDKRGVYDRAPPFMYKPE